ncbi:MAG: flagellar hook-basal body protein [Lachnospiraceae bacterium]|nr:flagellar hook-basal body protein [Lachnospiraceae bacterium]
MVRGLYTTYTGMVNEQKRLDVISNNLANADTVGYKTERVASQAFDDMLAIKIRDSSVGYQDQAIGSMSLGVKIGEVYTDYGQGAYVETGNTFDLAIDGAGFFTMRCPTKSGDNVTRYTRNGNFKMTMDGYVVDANGNHLQGSNGDIQVPVDATISINKSGQIFANDEYVDTVTLTDFEDYDYIKKYGDNLYQTVDGATTKTATGGIDQGYTEQSNVNVVSEMVDMITVTRAYEAGQKTMQTIDTMLEASCNEIGRVN